MKKKDGLKGNKKKEHVHTVVGSTGAKSNNNIYLQEQISVTNGLKKNRIRTVNNNNTAQPFQSPTKHNLSKMRTKNIIHHEYPLNEETHNFEDEDESTECCNPFEYLVLRSRRNNTTHQYNKSQGNQIQLHNKVLSLHHRHRNTDAMSELSIESKTTNNFEEDDEYEKDNSISTQQKQLQQTVDDVQLKNKLIREFLGSTAAAEEEKDIKTEEGNKRSENNSVHNEVKSTNNQQVEDEVDMTSLLAAYKRKQNEIKNPEYPLQSDNNDNSMFNQKNISNNSKPSIYQNTIFAPHVEKLSPASCVEIQIFYEKSVVVTNNSAGDMSPTATVTGEKWSSRDPIDGSNYHRGRGQQLGGTSRALSMNTTTVNSTERMYTSSSIQSYTSDISSSTGATSLQKQQLSTAAVVNNTSYISILCSVDVLKIRSDYFQNQLILQEQQQPAVERLGAKDNNTDLHSLHSVKSSILSAVHAVSRSSRSNSATSTNNINERIPMINNKNNYLPTFPSSSYLNRTQSAATVGAEGMYINSSVRSRLWRPVIKLTDKDPQAAVALVRRYLITFYIY